jgi:hypothetical protein
MLLAGRATPTILKQIASDFCKRVCKVIGVVTPESHSEQEDASPSEQAVPRNVVLHNGDGEVDDAFQRINIDEILQVYKPATKIELVLIFQ